MYGQYSSSTAALLLCLFAVELVSSFQQNSQYVITTDNSSDQQCHNCLTLMQFTLNVSLYVSSNTMLILQPGNHTLQSSLVVSNVETFTLYHVPHPNNSLRCEQSSKFIFSSIHDVNISSLSFIECFNSKAMQVNNLLLTNTSFHGSYSSRGGTALELTESNAIITSCFFTKYIYGTLRSVLSFSYKHLETALHHERRLIGGAMIINQSNVSIYQSNFTENRAQLGGAIYTESGSNVNISETSFVFNTAYSPNGDSEEVAAGGAIYATHSSSVTIYHSFFNNNQVYLGYRMGGTLTLYRSHLFVTGSI